jgi:hypothetical protein
MVYTACSSGYSVAGLLGLALAIGISYAVSITVGYRLAPRIGYYAILVTPLVQVGGVVLFFSVAALMGW